MSNHSIGTLTTRIIQNIDASTVAEVKTADFYDLLVTAYERYITATTKGEKKKDDTIDIEFQNRKYIFQETRKYLQGLLISPDEEVKSSAKKVYTEINRFGRDFLYNKTGDQSHNYQLIIAGLKKTELTADIELLKLNNKVVQLETAHRSYEAQYMQWGDFKKVSFTASKLRSDVEFALKNLIAELEWMLRKTPSEALKNLHTSIYTRIDEINLSNIKNKTDESADPNTGTETTA
ncbi:MAG: hypothetical protein KA206_07945 [Paludibacter sp.]|nr:hypothetical protein [Paludibacter sp.]